MADYGRAILKGYIGGLVQTRNMFYCEYFLGTNDTLPDPFAQYVEEVITPLLPIISTVWASTSLEIYTLLAGEWLLVEERNFIHAGSSGGQSLPYQIAIVLIGKALGKRHMGRKFFAGLSEANSEGSTMNQTAIEAAAASLLAYITPYHSTPNDSTILPGIMDATMNFHPFTGGIVSSFLGTMRRRKPGVGI